MTKNALDKDAHSRPRLVIILVLDKVDMIRGIVIVCITSFCSGSLRFLRPIYARMATTTESHPSA